MSQDNNNGYVFLVLGVSQADFTKRVRTASYVLEGGHVYIERDFVRSFFHHFPDAELKLKYQNGVFRTEEELKEWEKDNQIELSFVPKNRTSAITINPFPAWQDPDGSFGLSWKNKKKPRKSRFFYFNFPITISFFQIFPEITSKLFWSHSI